MIGKREFLLTAVMTACILVLGTVCPSASAQGNWFWNGTCSSCVAAEDGAVEEWDAIPCMDVTLAMDWSSIYMFRGFDIYGDDSAWQPSVEVGLWDTGLYAYVWASYAAESRDTPWLDGGFPSNWANNDFTEYDFGIYYTKNFCDCFDIETGLVYYLFPQYSNEYRVDYGNGQIESFGFGPDIDYWEWWGGITLSSWPLSPHATVYYGWADDNDGPGAGTMLDLGVSHTSSLCALPFLGSDEEIELTMTSDIWYNSHQYDVDPGWAYAEFGAGLDIPLCGGINFAPTVYYTYALDKDDPNTHNDEDEWWTILSLSKSF